MEKHPNEWNLNLLASSDNDTKLKESRTKSAEAIRRFSNKWQSDTSYLTSVKKMAEILGDFEELLRNHGINGREWYYFSLRSAQDQLDPQLKSLARNASEVSDKLYNQILFFYTSLKTVTPAKQKEFLSAHELKNFRHFLKREFEAAAHVLSLNEEKIMNLVSRSAHEAWVDMVSSFISKEEFEFTHEDNKHKLTPMPEILSLTSSQNESVRDSAADLVNTVMAKYADTATEEINAILYFKKINDELRQFDRPDSSRHLNDDIDTAVVDSLVNSVSNKNSIAAEFYRLKANLFGKKTLAYHERNVPYGSLDFTYNFTQATDLVEATLHKLDPEFSQIFTQFLENGQFDVYPRKGKVGGAFCAHNLIIQPTYILLNHTNKLQDVLTLAHEMGHGLHNEMARKHQNALNFGTSTATAEVASTFMEDFVIEELLKDANKEAQLALIMMKLNDDVSSIFRQVACYKFEQSLHQSFRENGYVSSEEIGKLFSQHMSSYMGPAVEQSAGSQNWWVYWSHIRSFFYVYSYASGLLISKSLQSLVRKNPDNIQKVKEFMAAGQSDSPQNIFLSAGLDISQTQFWDQGLSEVEHLLSQANQLATDLKLLSRNT